MKDFPKTMCACGHMSNDNAIVCHPCWAENESLRRQMETLGGVIERMTKDIKEAQDRLRGHTPTPRLIERVIGILEVAGTPMETVATSPSTAVADAEKAVIAAASETCDCLTRCHTNGHQAPCHVFYAFEALTQARSVKAESKEAY